MSRLSTALLCLALISLTLFSGMSVAVSSSSDDSAQYAIKSTLEDAGLSDVSTRIGDGRANGGEKVLILSYRSSAYSVDGLASEMSKIVGAYTGVLKTGFDCDSLMTVVGDSSGGAIGTWYCKKEWTDAYLNGEIDSNTLLRKVVGSMESFGA